ncbi:MAG TPA: alpha-2-macroglobulin family protein [Verrucomicrobiae bacterium]
MKTLLALAMVACFTVFSLHSQTTAEYAPLKTEAEKLFAEKSYAKANEVYAKAKALTLSTADTRWVEFRLADTQWRSAASTQQADTTKQDQARQALEVMVRDITREEDKDQTWAEVKESLGDFWWMRKNSVNWHPGWANYQPALEWWAGARDVNLARERYLGIVRKAAKPAQVDRWYTYGYYGNYLPLNVLENALKIAQTDTDKAQFRYLIAMTLKNQGGSFEQRQRVPEEFEAAIKFGKGNEWYDDALYQYGEWMMHQGRFVPTENGNYRQEPDNKKALEMFRKLVAEFTKGETRYFEQAQQRINEITGVQLGLGISHIFLPDSEVQYYLNWRNVKEIELSLYPVNLAKDVQMAGNEERRQNWLQSIELNGREKVKTWKHDTKDKGDYNPGNAQLRYEGKLPAGAYVLEAKAGGKSTRDIVLVTDASIVLKTSGKQALVYFCNALDGSPLVNGTVKVWQRFHDGNRWQWSQHDKATDQDGLALFELKDTANSVEIYVGAVAKDRQAFSLGNSYRYGRGEQPWRVYAFTDRPAYRPKEHVEWKIIARRDNGSVYSTPANETIWYRIAGPDNALLKEGEIKLNEFGSYSGSLELTESLRLGEYRVTFLEKNKNNYIGEAALFRLEEYKLPEFKVAVQTPEENGQRKIFRVGEQVEASIQADYYFGGAVANASVEVVVYQNPYYFFNPQPREFPWFYEDMDTQPNHWGRGGRGQILKRETLKTDATGKAIVKFETPANSGQDFEYQIEARVIDASRREIVGNGTVRVTRQRYYLTAKPDRQVIAPKDQTKVEITALDANNNPVKTEGEVSVTREYWWEIWLTPEGKEVKGDDLKRMKAQTRIWPPLPTRPDQKDWTLKFRGYEQEAILKQPLKTDAQGKGEFAFKAEKEGYYRIAYLTKDQVPNRLPQPINAETRVWVASNATTDTGYRTGGISVIVDKDTFRVGNEASVMLVANGERRFVLFSIEGERLDSYRLVRMDGPTKMLHILVEEKHVPNVFLSAGMVHEKQFHMDTRQVIVPPTKNFLTVDVKPDREQYQAREKGSLKVTTKDDAGKPVSAEVSVALVDESVYYIQGDYAGDMRRFFYGTKRPNITQNQSTFNQKSFVKLVEGENKQLIPAEQALREEARRQAGRERDARKDYYSESETVETQSAGVGGGVARGAIAMDFAATPMAAAAPAPAMEMAKSSRSLGTALKAEGKMKQQAANEPVDEPAVQVRNDFRSTILWQPTVITDAKGEATVEVTYPDSLTGWKATARAVSKGNQFGGDDATTRTKQPLIVRLQAPRFFVVGDEVVLSAVVNNNTSEEMSVKVSLDSTFTGTTAEADKRLPVPSLTFQVSGNDYGAAKAVTLKIPANSEARADWKARVNKDGPIKVKTTAIGGKYSDAMEKEYVVHEHGIEKFITKAGKVRGSEITLKLDIPKERKRETTALTVQVAPSMAVTMLDALPYLIDYPYGCTEQTMSRFLPAVVTAKTLKDLGLQPEDVMGKVFGGIEQANVAATQPKGKKNLERLDDMVKSGLARLYDFQHGDGGWGWWKQGESDRWMTAYVVWGLTLAKQSGTEIKADALSRGASYLDKTLVEEEVNPDMQAWMLHALAVYMSAEKTGKVSAFQQKAFDNLWKKRDDLNAYTRALFALSAHHLGKTPEAKTLIANLENGVKKDDRPDTSLLVAGVPTNAGVMGTAHWGEDGVWWRWSDGGVEATAWGLRALLTIDPKNKLVEPVSNWLIKNRRGAQWSNTRDTAMVVLAMNDYLRVSGELQPELEYEITVNGKKIAERKVSGADVFNAPSRFAVPATLVKDGANDIRIKRKGEGSIYFAAEAKFFSLEEPIPAAGNEIFVKREYFKLVGRPTLLKGYVYDKMPLKDGESVKSGERIETVITVETKNNYEYLLFEDLKPAGFEAVEIRSGESLYARELKSAAVERKHAAAEPVASSKLKVQSSKAAAPGIAARRPVVTRPLPPQNDDHTGRSRWVYQELRDRKVALFIDKLPEGVWEIRYDFRAEAPGQFHALPVLGHAMYVPEIRCNGAELRVTVVEDQK